MSTAWRFFKKLFSVTASPRTVTTAEYQLHELWEITG